MAERHLEIEQKYDAAPDFVLPDLSGLPGVAALGEPEVHELHATYFDTADLRLAANKITLRRRKGGTDAGWHLKMPAGPDSKQELRAPLGRPLVVPARLAGLVAAYTRGAELRPVATLETRRTVVGLLGADGAELAEVADDLVTGRGGEDAEPQRWREIEVELGTGGPDLLKAAGKRLRKGGAKRAKSSSKLGRLLGDAVVPSAAAAARARARSRIAAATSNGKAPAITTGEVVMAYLAEQVEAIAHFDPKARLGEHDAVHKMRVGVRRTRSALRSYRSVLDTERTARLGPELRWLAQELGEVRDREVLRMRFQGAPEFLLDDLEKQERSAYRRLNAALKEPRYFALLDELDRLISAPPLAAEAGRKARKELPGLVTRAWDRMAKEYASIKTADDPDTARHETRKEAKRVRYAAELAVPVLGVAAKRVVEDAKRIQSVLGGYQDGVIAMEHLAAAAKRTKIPAEAFTLGVLYGKEESDAMTARDRLATTWSRTLGPSF
ncbi:CYTH and CHAD domain-containing protein [Actinomadura bangladeshensis]|uniref:CYTH and CHAD domain-containing protein n=1 Tax=Actinomadura bangladeshensis TaxID=453573 RepID=A0A4R4P060_9ACTN|nr:CYTH and CHAD domain-containing protein [Actinomadura bangladeshensis]TDC13983.1 CYTH and CHAD domain-containing protein [Actinomadura bangladeshensis]